MQVLTALNIIEAKQERDKRGLAGAGVAYDGQSLAGLDAEGDITENPVVFARIRDGAVTEPNITKFDFTARMFVANCRMLNFSLRSWMGRKKRVANIVNSVRTPKLRAPASTRLPPDQ